MIQIPKKKQQVYTNQGFQSGMTHKNKNWGLSNVSNGKSFSIKIGGKYAGGWPGIFPGSGDFCKLGHKLLTVLRDKVKYV